MGDATVPRLSCIDWCRDLINDPAWIITRSGTREPKSDSADSFMAETLGTERTIRAFLTLRPAEEEKDQDGPAFREVRTIIEIGDGLNGHPNICHGGFVATMLDEVFGVLIILNIEKRGFHMKETGVLDAHSDMVCFTAYLNTNYKSPVPAPAVLLCTAKYEKREGKKIYVTGTIEDGMGTVYTTGEGMFIETIRKSGKL